MKKRARHLVRPEDWRKCGTVSSCLHGTSLPPPGSGVSPASEGGRESRGSGGPVRGSPDPLALAERAEDGGRGCPKRKRMRQLPLNYLCCCIQTTLANFCTALYGRTALQDLSGISTLRVSSTEFKSEECISLLKDATFIFDDLCKANDKKVRKGYEKRVRNIIRNFADNSPRTTARSSFENNCQVIITSEYL